MIRVPRQLLEALRSRPDDDEVRSVYADALLDQGDPLGELVEVQCELARLAREGGDRERAARLRKREAALLRSRGDAFVAELGLREGEAAIVRGLVEELTVAPHRLREIAPVLRRSPVVIRKLRLAYGPGDERLEPRLDLDDPVLAELEVLVVDVELSERMVPAVMGSAAARRARVLSLVTGGSEAFVPALARAELDAEHVVLRGRATAALGYALGEAPWLARVTRLAIEGCALGDEGVRALGRPGAAAGVRQLELSGCGLGDARALSGVLAWPSLTALEAPANALTMRHLPTVTSPLARLNLSFNEIGMRGARNLLGWQAIADLASLELWSNPFGSTWAALLRRRFGARVRVGQL